MPFAKVSNAIMLLIATVVQGCITSKFPLLEEETAVSDPYFTGHYKLNDPPPGEKPLEYDVYLRDRRYLLVANDKLQYIGTLHEKRAGLFIAQLRAVANSVAKGNEKSVPYAYMLIRKTDAGADLNLIKCAITEACEVKEADELLRLATDADEHPDERQLATATKIADFIRPDNSGAVPKDRRRPQ